MSNPGYPKFKRDPNKSPEENAAAYKQYLAERKAFYERRRAQRAKELAERRELVDQESEAKRNLLDAQREEARLNREGTNTNPRFSVNRKALEAIRKERIAEKQAEVDKRKAIEQGYRDQGEAYMNKKREEAEAAQKEEDDMNWTYVGGDKDTANERYRTIKKTDMQEVETEETIEKPFNDGKPTGVTDEDVWKNNVNNVREKFDSFDAYKDAAEEYRQSQTSTETIKTKKLVPVESEERITQTREDFERTNHWSTKLKPGMIVNMSVRINRSGKMDMTPDKLEQIFKDFETEKEAVRWARDNGLSFLIGKSSGNSGSSTTRGKTSWKG